MKRISKEMDDLIENNRGDLSAVEFSKLLARINDFFTLDVSFNPVDNRQKFITTLTIKKKKRRLK